MSLPTNQGPRTSNLMFAILSATFIMITWQIMIERPRMAQQQQEAAKQAAKAKADLLANLTAEEKAAASDPTANAPRIKINTPTLHGSISVVGSRFDDLTLANYRETLDPKSPEVTLLKRSRDKKAYFVELGVLGEGTLPNASTQWQTNDRELTVEKPITLTWSNGAGLHFTRKIAVDEHYMFTVTTTVRNEGNAPVTIYPYGLISRNEENASGQFMHIGPLGVMNGVLEDLNYKDLKKESKKFEKAGSWLGITDKYWLTAIVPENKEGMDAEFKHFMRGESDAYQADLRGQAVDIPVGQQADVTMRVFAGAKEIKQLDRYRNQYNIPLFDRAVDFGSLYFLMRPMFLLLSYFYTIVGNFGVAIIMLTVVIKALLYPLAHKSMIAMARMKQLTPKMNEIRARFKDDKMRLNQEMMALYKTEKVNPAAGCLPMLLQIPVFLALYRVLSVTIEMRHAPFYGWIHDLSAPDPSNLFNLFGLLAWHPPIHLGFLPIVMCATMVIQQRFSPKPADEVQAAMIKFMPYVFLIMFASFPAGLVLYWVVSNILSIVQQWYINGHLDKKGLR